MAQLQEKRKQEVFKSPCGIWELVGMHSFVSFQAYVCISFKGSSMNALGPEFSNVAHPGDDIREGMCLSGGQMQKTWSQNLECEYKDFYFTLGV